jgi:hypothetical protein
MSFDECELAILRHAVDETTEVRGKEAVNNDDIRKMVRIIEDFLRNKHLICYGGTAVNNILPKSAQFYNRETEIPDYDFYSKNALDDTKELCDIFFNEGFINVEGKSGIHKGTYKVFVNFIPIADITFLHSEIYNNLDKEAITIMGIKYCPPNYLRMSMYLELSRPAGDVSRWEKVFKRLVLLNKYHPLKSNIDCKSVKDDKIPNEIGKTNVYEVIKKSFIDQGVVFFGGYATYLYSKHIPKKNRRMLSNTRVFDILSDNPSDCALILKDTLSSAGIKNTEVVHHNGIEDIIPDNVEIKVNGKTRALIYKQIACHSYNSVKINEDFVNIATIDTMLSFYLAFMYYDNNHYNKDRILCIAKYMYEIEKHNRLSQSGILKRFSKECYGVQKTLSTIRAEKAEMYKKLSNDKTSKEFQEWFFKYIPTKRQTTESKTTKTAKSNPTVSEPEYKSKPKSKKFNKRRYSHNKTQRKKKTFLEMFNV